jgi:hypothetical protein
MNPNAYPNHQTTRPARLAKGRKPRNAGQDLSPYATWFYHSKWTKSLSQRQLAKQYADAQGSVGDHRAHIRHGMAEIDALLKLIALPARIRVSP